MSTLKYLLKGLCARNREGSFSTQASRLRNLLLIADQLKTLGYRNMQTHSLKPKHITALVSKWQQEKCSASTIKNRMSILRWWAEKIQKPGIIEKDNAEYGIESRTSIAKTSKAVQLQEDVLAKINDVHIQFSLKLQAAFGLRREEAMKFIAKIADKQDYIYLKGSWTKGGRERIVPIRTDVQRILLNQIHEFAKNNSLIPESRSYKQHLRIFERQTSGVGLNKTHGLRHAYAQARYLELTGWAAPVCGGPSRTKMNDHDRTIDFDARKIISNELGHGREQVTTYYLGR